MKNILLIIALLFVFIILSNCEKNEIDKNTLYYVDIIPDTNWIDIDNDSQKDIILFDSIVNYIIPGDTLFLHTKFIKSTNDNILISWGKNSYPYYEYLLEKDSIVDNSLVWESSFLIWGPGPWMNYGHNPDYIGIKYFENNDTLYGWIYKTTNSFAEYAIDISQNANKKIYAGHKYK